ncbi:hypothetical protein PMIT1303_00119 [Prochlorococcus sp. MIT 1303]|nr:hypothetical protein PMIT1303_00119 [Prochlorococcus sp. MIT 1303]
MYDHQGNEKFISSALEPVNTSIESTKTTRLLKLIVLSPQLGYLADRLAFEA